MISNRLRAYIYILLVVIIWGAASPIIKFTLDGIDPLPFLAYRFGLASLFSLGFFAFKIKKGKQFRQLRKHFSLATLYGLLAMPLGLGVLFLALDKTTVLDLTLIGVMGPIMITLGGVIFFHDRITKREKVGMGIVLIGVFFNSFIPLFSAGTGIRLTGNILLIIYLLADTASILIAKRMVRYKVKSANLTNFGFIVGAFTVIPIALYFYGIGGLTNIIISLPFKYHLGVWYMAFLSGNLAYYLYVRGQRTIEVSEATLFNYLQPVITIPLAIFWLHETLNIYFLIGALLIAVGLFFAESKKG